MADYGQAPTELLRALGQRARELRLVRGLRQTDLARRADVGVRTVERFERTGIATLENVVRMAIALGAEHAFERLFEAPAYASLDEALQRPRAATRRRARRRT